MVSLPFFPWFIISLLQCVTECTIGNFFFYEIQNSDYWCRNLSVGGSGKSPMVMYMADLLSKISELSFV